MLNLPKQTCDIHKTYTKGCENCRLRNRAYQQARKDRACEGHSAYKATCGNCNTARYNYELQFRPKDSSLPVQSAEEKSYIPCRRDLKCKVCHD